MKGDEITPDDVRMLQLGQALRILFSNGGGAFPVAAVYAWLWPAIRLNQIVFVADSTGRPAAYITYAFVTAQTRQTLVETDPAALDIADWNDGTLVWICDYRGPRAMLSAAARALSERLGDHETAYAAGRRGGRASLRVFRTTRRAWNLDA